MDWQQIIWNIKWSAGGGGTENSGEPKNVILVGEGRLGRRIEII